MTLVPLVAAGQRGKAFGRSPTAYSALDSPSTVVYRPRPQHPLAADVEFPRKFLDSRMGFDVDSNPIAYGTTVNLSQADLSSNGSRLQQEIDTAAALAGNTDIILTGNWSTPITHPQLRKHTAGDYHTRIRWGNLSVPEGTRATPADLASAPIFMGAISGPMPALSVDRAANNTRLVGIRFKFPTGTVNQLSYDLVRLYPVEGSNQTEYLTDPADFPDQLGFDRCVIEGNDSGDGVTVPNVRNGFTIGSKRTFLVDSTVHQIGWITNESKAVISYNSPGPIKLVGNLMEAHSEVLLFGGVVPAAGRDDGRPCDVEIRRNLLTRRKSWSERDPSFDEQEGRQIKNIFESKNLGWALVEGNVFESTWVDAQDFAIVIKSSAGGAGGVPGAAGCETAHLTFRYNIVRDSVNAFNLCARPDETDAILGNHQAYYDNLAYNIGDYAGWVDGELLNGDPIRTTMLCNFTGAMQQFRFFRNTLLMTGSPNPATHQFKLELQGGDPMDDWRFIGNIVGYFVLTHFDYGTGPGGSDVTDYGTDALASATGGEPYLFENNVIYNHTTDPNYANNRPLGTNQYTSQGALGFVDANNDNYRLDGTSPFKGDGYAGEDPGCNVDDVELATLGVAS